jgi:hypothetical protein
MISRLTDSFNEQLTQRGGIILKQRHFSNDTFRSGILLKEDIIQPGDTIYGGIAMLASEDGLSAKVHSFAIRQVCSNGMVSPFRSKESYTVSSSEEVGAAFDKVQTSLESGELNELAGRFRQSQLVSVKNNLPVVANLIFHMLTRGRNDRWGQDATRQIAQRRQVTLRLATLMEAERDRPVNHARRHEPASMFELVNAVTDLAKEVRNPRVAWSIMEYGSWLLDNLDTDFEQDYSERRIHNVDPDLVW